MTLLLPLLAFVCGSLLITALAYAVLSTRSADVGQRLRDVIDLQPGAQPLQAPSSQQVAGFLRSIGERVPRSAKELGKLQLRLVQAGYRQSEALPIFLAIRVAFGLAAFGICMTPLVIRPSLTIAVPAMGFGYILPAMLLARMAKRRQHRIRLSLAVAQELAFAYPDLSGELRLLNLEMLAGKARPEALRNLADRTGVDDLSSLVTMLIQTDKFGTSVANSLRVFSETLRTKRRQRAEEAAAKTGVKMVFPLVLCIFPAIWIVTIGPAAIRFIRVLGPIANGIH